MRARRCTALFAPSLMISTFKMNGRNMIFFKKSSQHTLKPLYLSIHIVLGVGSSLLGAQQCYAQSQPTHYEIAAGSLSNALLSFALQSNSTLSVDHQKLKGLSSAGLSGQYTVAEGYNRLLANSPYQIQLTSTGYVLVAKTSSQSHAAHYVGQLQSIDVQAADDQSQVHIDLLPTITVDAQPASAWSQQVSLGALGNKSLLDTPYSVNLKTAEEIDTRQSNVLGKVFVGDPSIVTEVGAYSSGWSTPISIRGLQLDVSNAYKVNGHTVSVWGGEFPLQVVDSVTALKGLTGLMYGFAAPGGSIDYRSKQPTDQPLLSTSFGYRSAGIFSAHIDSGGRLGAEQQFGYRLNVAKEKGKNSNGTKLDNLVTGLALDYRILPNLTWRAEVIDQDRHLDNEATMFMFGSYVGDTLPKAISGNSKHIVKGAFYTIHSTLADTALEWQINPIWKAQLSYAYSRNRNAVNKSFGYILNPAGDYSINMYQLGGVSIYQLTQATFSGSFSTGAVQHELQTGSAYRKKTGSDRSYDWYSEVGTGNIYHEQTSSYANRNRFIQTDSGAIYQKELFLSDTLHFNAHWQALIGARYTNYQDQSSGYSTEVTTPTYALIFKPTAHIALYASYVEALEAGQEVSASSAKPYANAGQVLDPTISQQYEIGAKFDLQGLNASIALYRLEKAAKIDEYRGSALYLTQNGISRYQGVELMGGYQLHPDLKLNLGLLLSDPSLRKLSDDNQNLEGHRPEGASKYQAVLQADWNIPYWSGLSLHGDLRYYGDRYVADDNQLRLPSYTLLNLGAAYTRKISTKALTLSADLNNVFNRHYWMNSGVGEAINLSLSAKIAW
jgi:iron complex outermembrane receptor protein